MTNANTNSDSSGSPGNSGSPSAQHSQSRALEIEVRLFCRSFRLTPRETEIVNVLADGVVRIKDVADRLGLSPNTVNNHVNSIFLKTKTRSKSELLAVLLKRISEDLHWSRLMRQSPRVLWVTERTSSEMQPLIDLFNQRKVRVQIVSRGQAETFALSFLPHFVFYDLDSRGDLNIPEAVAAVSGRFSGVSLSRIIFISEKVVFEDRCLIMHEGGADVMTWPSSPDDYQTFCSEAVAFILSDYIQEDEDRARYLEFEIAAAVKPAVASFNYSSDDWGHGGIFLSLDEIQRCFETPLEMGDWIEFKVIGSNKPAVVVRGRVAWVRKTAEVTTKPRVPGVGVRVTPLDPHVRELLAHGSRTAYIPVSVPF